MKIVFLGLGSNLGNRQHNIDEAVAGIGELIGTVEKSSFYYETEPWGFKSENKFLNSAIKVSTDLEPGEVLEKIHMIESLLGRVRGEEQYSSRLIDIDILFYDNLRICTDKLVIPHPLLHDRRFVLVPMNEIAPELVHPVLGKTVSELLAVCNDHSTPLSAKL